MKARTFAFRVFLMLSLLAGFVGLHTVSTPMVVTAQGDAISTPDLNLATPIATINDPALLPRALTATPTGEDKATNSLTPTTISIATINNPALLPQALSATPTPSPAVSPTPQKVTASATSNHELLDEALTNTMSANFVRFALNADLSVTINNMTGDFQIESVGFATHLNSLQDFSFQDTATVTYADDTGIERQIVVEERLVRGVLYVHGEDPATNRQTHWIAIQTVDVIDEMLGPLIQALPGFSQTVPGFGQTVPSLSATSEAFQSIMDLLDFDQYIITKRLDQGQSTAHFQTDVNIDGFLKSRKDVTALLTALTALGGLNLDQTEIGTVVSLFQRLRWILIPHVGLTIDTEVDAQQKVLTLAALDFASAFSVGSIVPLQLQPVQAEAHVTLGLSGYASTTTETVEVPPDVLTVTDLNSLSPDKMFIPLTTATPGATESVSAGS